MSRDDPGQLARAAARRELDSLKIEALDEISIEDIAARRDLFVGEGSLDGADGRTVSQDGAGIIRIRRDITQPGRRRFVIAHELGHWVLQGPGKLNSCSARDLLTFDGGNPEADANYFAAELLMPGKLVRPYCNVPPSFAAVEEIKRRCGTTFTASAIRFVQLSPESCALVWSEDSKVKWVVRSADFEQWIERGRPLSTFSHAGDAFRGKALPREAQEVPQHAWIDQRVQGERALMEETRHFEAFGATLTLLWFPVSPDDDDDDDHDDDDDPRWRR